MVKFDYEFIEKVCDVLNGDRGENYPSNSDFQKYGIPFVNAGHLQEGSIDFSKMDYITAEQYNRMGGAKLQKGDILYCLRGSLGKFAIYPRDGGAPASSLAVIRCGISLDTNFLFQILGSNIINEQIMTENNGSSQPNLSATSLKNFKIPLPPLSEQRAIAAVLSDMDDYISTLEQLIAKKRNIKKGAMQELLTGKRRLPGFEGEWEKKTLFELVPNLRMGQSPDSRFYNTEGDGLPLIQGHADIENQKTIIRFYTSQITKCAYVGDTILTVRAPVGKVAKAAFNCCLGRGVCGFSYPNEFLYQWLLWCEPLWGSMSTGSTFDSISSETLKKVNVYLPADENEQSAIANILSDMDAEIDALETKLKKARNIKQGMMEELLTGHIRLIEDEIDNVSNE